ncbi:monooxygenase [Photobacterium japonica]|uniref:monooxygenase n=1 Tax=Photobacterium japonica TaxID=2910235 RepID=UPI003D0C7F95
MTQTLLQVDFNHQGPFGEEMATQLAGLAASINEEPGFIWKIWTENEAEQLAGGVYLFADAASAQAYLTMHTARLTQMGFTGIRGRVFNVNADLSTINQATFAL